MKIEIFSDFSCPFCYIAKTKLLSAIKELQLTENVEIDYKAYQLKPDASKTQTLNYKDVMQERFSGNMAKMQEAIDAVYAHANEDTSEPVSYFHTFHHQDIDCTHDVPNPNYTAFQS